MSGAIAYYMTAHGYGHGTRSCDIVRALMERPDGPEIHIVTTLPESFLLNRLPGTPTSIRPRSLDVGMVQLDSVRVDIAATLQAVDGLDAQWGDQVETERRWLNEAGVETVVCDIPGIPLQAAAEEGIRSLAAGNFSWDWIYAPFADQDPIWSSIIERYHRAYQECDLLMRLPFSDRMLSFPRRVDVPLLSRPGVDRRAAIAGALGMDPLKIWVLISFSHLEWDAEALYRVQQLSDYEFLTVQPLVWEGRNLYAVDRNQFAFSDVLASCDLVLSKPGYGILSDCVVNQKPTAYVERENFVEYPILEEALQGCLQHVHLPASSLYQGEIGRYLEALLAAPQPCEFVPRGGDQIAARLILGADESNINS